MPITSSVFEVEYKGSQLKGVCTIIDLPGNTEQPYKYPLYRLSFHNHRTKPDIYLFYKTDAEGKPFFWYRSSAKNPKLSEALSKELERKFINN